ncbi:PilZ domain-containing protein [Pyrinomonas methylaliphatogenes]|uniref:PilZ domain-containing protein n=2 Tax=Pyrinomonas methylaliphatogenes TaxID=454194 RepID=A0A0B6WVC4_9BACT|nr:PilZ domain-containing protein [Pyrinomonas methylaliphatogenes]
MMSDLSRERRIGTRYPLNLPVRVEWDDETVGRHVLVEGETQNVGPDSALVHLRQLPQVGSRVRLAVIEQKGPRFEALAEVLRLERDPAQPLAALRLLSSEKEWRTLIAKWMEQQRQRSAEEETD